MGSDLRVCGYRRYLLAVETEAIAVHGGVKFYRGPAKAARTYLESDHSPADDYYLREGSGLAQRFIATPDGLIQVADMDGDTYEKWVAGIDVDTGQAKGRLREDGHANRYAEITVNGPKTWSLAAALSPAISEALDAAQDEAAKEIISYLAQHATTRIGGRGKQVQIPVEKIEVAVIRHYTSRAGDPHRHLHLQINVRVWAAGAWRGIHTVGVRDQIEAINGIGHAAVITNPTFRRVLAEHGFTIDPETSEIRELQPYVGAFSARAAQITANVEKYEAEWRKTHPGEEPGPRLREAWDRRAWAEARPDKVIPTDGAELVARWNQELRDLGYQDPAGPVPLTGTLPGVVNRDAAAEFVVRQVGSKKSAWNPADLRGKVEILLAQVALLADPAVRIELAEDIVARALGLCEPLLSRPDVPEHIRSYTSPTVLEVETDILTRMSARAITYGARADLPRGWDKILNPEQVTVVKTLAGTGQLVVVEGAAGTGKTTTLKATHTVLATQRRRMIVVTPTLKAAEVAARETGAVGHSAAWLIHQHGWRWDDDGNWTRQPTTPAVEAQLRAGDLLVVDEAGMLDQDTARALRTIADETGARVGFIGDRHQLPAVGRGGVFDHATTWTHPRNLVSMDRVQRFTDPKYARVSQHMRVGREADAVFDWLNAHGHIVIHPTDIERTAALARIAADTGDMVLADTRDQVTKLNAAIRQTHDGSDAGAVVATTGRGEQIGLGDRVATRRNDPLLGVANRQTWTVTGTGRHDSLIVRPTDGGKDRELPATYVTEHVELAYATTVHGAQGETTNRAHLVVDHHTGGASAYVGMTRGRDFNTAHLVADSLDDAKQQWVDTFGRDRADLGPAHARQQALQAIDQYGPNARPRRPSPAAPYRPSQPTHSPGIGF